MSRGCVILLAAWLALAAGCGRRELSRDEIDRGRAAVETGLQAWQKGERPAALEKQDPPIQFRDEDWARGLRLTDWEITGTDGAAGDRTPRCTVVLSLLDRHGQKISRRVVYQVEHKGAIAVVRDPYF